MPIEASGQNGVQAAFSVTVIRLRYDPPPCLPSLQIIVCLNITCFIAQGILVTIVGTKLFNGYTFATQKTLFHALWFIPKRCQFGERFCSFLPNAKHPVFSNRASGTEGSQFIKCASHASPSSSASRISSILSSLSISPYQKLSG